MNTTKKLSCLIDQNTNCISYFILILVSISFVLTDWIIYLFTFSEIVMVIILVLLLISRNLKMNQREIIYILFIEILLLSNLILNYYFNEDFIFRRGLAGAIKITFFLLFIAGIFRYIKDNKLSDRFLLIINRTAIIVIIVGFIINLSIFFEIDQITTFLWTFTRSDPSSYLYRGSSSIIRSRSLFSEPAHFGYYLNVILAINLFTRLGQNIITKWINIIIIFSVLSTLSYGSVAVMMISIILKSFFLLRNNFNTNTLITSFINLSVIILVFYMFRDSFNEAIIERTNDIITGQDNSSFNRIINSWKEVNKENIFLGNGIGHTSTIYNIYAYILSDIGVVSFILSIIFTIYIVINNYGVGLIFVALNFVKGGYLSAAFWIVILLLFVFIDFSTLKAKFRRKETFNG